MADTKISALTAYTLAKSTDVVLAADGSTGIPKKITVEDLRGYAALSSGAAVTSTTLVDITGMSVALTPGTWVFSMLLSGNSSTSAGGKFGVQYSGTATVNATFQGQTSSTGFAATARITTLNTASTTMGTTTSAQTANLIFGELVATTSGNLTARALKVTSGTLTIDASSWMRAFRVA